MQQQLGFGKVNSLMGASPPPELPPNIWISDDDSIAINSEHKMNLAVSKQNIEKTRPLINGWMSERDINELIALSFKSKFNAPCQRKFVNRMREF